VGGTARQPTTAVEGVHGEAQFGDLCDASASRSGGSAAYCACIPFAIHTCITPPSLPPLTQTRGRCTEDNPAFPNVPSCYNPVDGVPGPDDVCYGIPRVYSCSACLYGFGGAVAAHPAASLTSGSGVAFGIADNTTHCEGVTVKGGVLTGLGSTGFLVLASAASGSMALSVIVIVAMSPHGCCFAVIACCAACVWSICCCGCCRRRDGAVSMGKLYDDMAAAYVLRMTGSARHGLETGHSGLGYSVDGGSASGSDRNLTRDISMPYGGGGMGAGSGGSGGDSDLAGSFQGAGDVVIIPGGAEVRLPYSAAVDGVGGGDDDSDDESGRLGGGGGGGSTHGGRMVGDGLSRVPVSFASDPRYSALSAARQQSSAAMSGGGSGIKLTRAGLAGGLAPVGGGGGGSGSSYNLASPGGAGYAAGGGGNSMTAVGSPTFGVSYGSPDDFAAGGLAARMGGVLSPPTRTSAAVGPSALGGGGGGGGGGAGVAGGLAPARSGMLSALFGGSAAVATPPPTNAAATGARSGLRSGDGRGKVATPQAVVLAVPSPGSATAATGLGLGAAGRGAAGSGVGGLAGTAASYEGDNLYYASSFVGASSAGTWRRG